MTIEEMVVRLGIHETELEMLKDQEQSHSLPGKYMRLADYLGSLIFEQQNTASVELVRLINARIRKARTLEEKDKLYEKLRLFVATL